jgi:hypothetical protein
VAAAHIPRLPQGDDFALAGAGILAKAVHRPIIHKVAALEQIASAVGLFHLVAHATSGG